MTHIYFVRHAESNYNNHDDLSRELTSKGLQDRKLVTGFLSDKQIDAVISSPYKRAVDTIWDFADNYGFEIEIIDHFRERKITDNWISTFAGFTKKQWENFSFKLPGGESLNEVQKRNISGLELVLKKYCGKNVVIGSHGTALSTVINYYDNSFGYKDFEKIKCIMPFIVEFVFDDDLRCTKIEKYFFDMTS